MKPFDTTLFSTKIVTNEIKQILKLGDSVIFMASYGETGFSINCYDVSDNVPLHFHARPDLGVCVLNSCQKEEWGAEQWVKAFPAEIRGWFQFSISLDYDGFCVEIDSKKFCHYRYRNELREIVSIKSPCDLWVGSSYPKFEIDTLRFGPHSPERAYA